MQDRRQERRLRYHWPIWIKQDPAQEHIFNGHMVDINSRAAAFTIDPHACSIRPNQHLLARFGVPRFNEDGSMDVAEFARWGHVTRVSQVSGDRVRVVMCLHEPLPFQPGHQHPYMSSEPVLV